MRWSIGYLLASLTTLCPAVAAPIHDAAKTGDTSAIMTAIETGADVNESDGWATPLWYAARRGHEDAVKLLIAKGADINLSTQSSGPPLLGAIDGKNGNLVRLFLAYGANPNLTLNTNSALYLATKKDCFDCVTALVEAGADVNALNQDREPPLHWARTVKSRSISDYLIKHGAVSPKIPSISAKLRAADPAKGQVIFIKKCEGCHFIVPQKARKIGPNLWGVVGRPKASLENFSYSETLKNWGSSWSYDDLNAFLWGPKITAPGVRMLFEGIEDEEDRVNLIAYLRVESSAPEPLP